MWLVDLLQDSLLSLCYALVVRRPVLLVGFIEAAHLRRLASLLPHRSLLEVPDWHGAPGQDPHGRLAQLSLLLQGESANLQAPRVTLVAPNLSSSALPALLEIPRGWVASTLNGPGNLPSGVVAFDLRTKNLLNADPSTLDSPHLRCLISGLPPKVWETLLREGLRVIAAKAQGLFHLTTSGVEAEQVIRLLGIFSQHELDLCVAIAQADYQVDLSTFHRHASSYMRDNPPAPPGKELQRLRRELEQLRRETLHVDDIRTMLTGITDTLTQRGVPPDLLHRVINKTLREWLPTR